MATLPPSAPSRDLAAAHHKVQHPLERLRHYIRLYVTLEGAAALLLYLTLWFWIGLALDYGLFLLTRSDIFFQITKEAPLDWVQVLPVWFRGSILLLLVAGVLAVVAFKVIVRLLYDFSASALALVLERKFPHLLGDRLITAVELADVKKAARYGYSEEMIEETINDAAGKVDELPVGEVFNWNRLANAGIVVGVLLVGVYLLVGGTASAVRSAHERQASMSGFGQLHDVSALWGSRNLLLRNTPWPRNAFLELVGFPESGELRIGQDSPAPALRVRALEWVWADPEVPEGWRALNWLDLKEQRIIVEDVPELPASFQAQRTDWTVDQVELQLARTDVGQLLAIKKVMESLDQFTQAQDVTLRQNPSRGEAGGERWVIRDPGAPDWRPLTWADLERLAPGLQGQTLQVPNLPAGWPMTVDQIGAKLVEVEADKLAALADVLARLKVVVQSGKFKWQLRKLAIPQVVSVLSRGPTTRNEMTLEKQGDNNEYAGTFSDLKESVRFTIRGEDYFTPWHTITLVPPPTLSSLVCDEFRPAYLFYRVPPDGTVDDLKGLKQVFRDRPISLTGGDTSRVEVPAGTDLIMTATADKELNDNGVRILPPRKGVAAVNATVTQTGPLTFVTEFKNIRMTQDFVFEITDTDNVVSLRHVIIKPLEDVPPDADVQVEVIRKTNQGYIVTPRALIPFSGKVRDDHGLETAEFAYNAVRMDSTSEGGGKALLVMSALYQLLGGPGQDLFAALQIGAFAKDTKPGQVNEAEQVERIPLQSFVTRLRDRANEEALPLAELRDLVGRNPPDPVPRPIKDKPERTISHPITQRTLLREHTLDPEEPSSSLDLQKLSKSLEVTDVKQIQPRYRMSLWMEVTDNDVLTGPHRNVSKEKFTFLVVSENELLSEIGKEEESLHVKLDDMVNRLKESRSKLDTVIGDLGPIGAPPLKADQFPPVSVRAEEIEQLLEKSSDLTREVFNDYQRILKELRTNRVQPGMIARVEKTIVEPLEDVMRPGGAFSQASDALKELRRAMDDKTAVDLGVKSETSRKGASEARAKLEVLIQKLNAVLNAMEGIISINRLIEQLKKLEEEERVQYEVLQRLKDQIEKELLDQLFGPGKK